MRRRAAILAVGLLVAGGIAAWMETRRASAPEAGAGSGAAADGADRAAGLASVRRDPAKAAVTEFTAKDALETPAPEDAVYGVVESSDGTSVDDLRVWAAPARRDLQIRRGSYGSSVTGADGAFRIRSLPSAEDIQLIIGLDGSKFVSKPVAARTGGPPARLTIARRPVLAVTVLDSAGKPVRGAAATLTGRTAGASIWERSWLGGSTTDAAGVAHLTWIDAELVWTLRVEPPLDRDDAGVFVSEGWSPAETSVQLPSAQTLEGVVRDEQGQPNADAHLWWRLEVGTWRPAQIQFDATFEIPRLGLGTVQLLVLPWAPFGDPKPEWKPQRIVDAGAKNVVLSVARGARLEVLVKDWESYAPGSAFLAREGSDEQSMRAPLATDGRIRFEGLDPDATYLLWVPGVQSYESIEKLRCVLKPEVRANMSPLTVTMEAQKSARLRLGKLPGEQFQARIDVAQGLRIDSYTWLDPQADPDHLVLLFCPVLDGETSATVEAFKGKETWRAKAQLRPGKTAEGTWELVPTDPAPADR